MVADIIVRNIPVVLNAYGFVKTAKRVYNSTSLVGAVTAAVKGIVVDCSPPQVKYPLN